MAKQARSTMASQGLSMERVSRKCTVSLWMTRTISRAEPIQKTLALQIYIGSHTAAVEAAQAEITSTARRMVRCTQIRSPNSCHFNSTRSRTKGVMMSSRRLCLTINSRMEYSSPSASLTMNEEVSLDSGSSIPSKEKQYKSWPHHLRCCFDFIAIMSSATSGQSSIAIDRGERPWRFLTKASQPLSIKYRAVSASLANISTVCSGLFSSASMSLKNPAVVTVFSRYWNTSLWPMLAAACARLQAARGWHPNSTRCSRLQPARYKMSNACTSPSNTACTAGDEKYLGK
mmetsp:Transcript_85560/g.167423  ORF Transcript_85560/g.167423 Transcript_85560/m.167423 type:complete len:288 (-) Transcript_85560:60-923(-)